MHRAGYRTIAACEVIDWRRALYSQNNPGVPVYDDVTTLTADRLVRDGVGLPDIIVGSPPCQDISSANTKGKGVDGERSGLYFEAVRLIDECRPRWFALENSANLRTRGADRIIDALAAIGYTCWPFVVSAGDIGANHERKRSWLIGYSIADANRNFVREQSGRSGRPDWTGEAVAEFSADRERGVARNASKDGCGQGRTWRRVESIEGLSVEACGDANATGVGYEGRRPRRHWAHGDGAASTFADTNGQGQLDSAINGQVGGSEGASGAIAEPWSDWNGGLAHHLRVDDGLSAWVAKSRIAVGSPRGTIAASLIVEAFGDAVLPQIPEAIGRAILRVERALAAITAKPTAANDNNANQDQAIAAA
jgi:DNA (cytosine-5)-methyltransferase 1